MRTIKLLFLLPLSLFALEREPWFGNVWEFRFIPSYTYSRYTQVQNGHPQLKNPSNDQDLDFDLAFAPVETWSFDVEMEFVNTPRQKWGMRSAAVQVRQQWLNDVVGDSVSFVTGLDARTASRHSLRDVSSPYHSDLNIEASAALGKEWDRETMWTVRTYGYGAVGIANHGAPWLTLLASVEGNHDDRHRFGVLALGYFGFGSHERVKINHFHGYGTIKHRSVDLGAHYSYVFEVWGHLTFEYTYRLWAVSFPEHVNFFTLRYTLPFSFF